MSVGFDFGNQNLVIAVVQKGGIDVVANEASSRQTPAFVSFGPKERGIGEVGLTMFMRNVRNTIRWVKRLVGRSFSDPIVQNEIPRVPFTVKQLEGDKIGIEVSYAGNQVVFVPEQIAAMLLGNMKNTAEKALGTKVQDVVVGVPGYWTDQQRRAMISAAEIAGLNVLKLINEHAATALQSGFYKTDLPEKESHTNLLVDMGNSSTTASVISFNKAGFRVLATKYAPCLGGRDFDETIALFVAKQNESKIGNLKSNPRGWNRLLEACEKQIKKVISSGNNKAFLSVENIANDMDINVPFTREQFDQVTSHLLDQLTTLIASLLEQTGVKPETLHAVEITGGGSRLNTVQERLQKITGKQLSKTINCEESIARGAALQCAMISPTFRVRDYKVEDTIPYPISISWKTLTSDSNSMDDGDSAEIIPTGSVIPSPKLISFTRKSPIVFTAYHSDPNKTPVGTIPEIGKFSFPEIPEPQGKETPALKIRASLNLHGIFNVEDGTMEDIIEELVEVEEKPEPPKKEEKKEDKKEAKKDEEKKEEKTDEKKEDKKDVKMEGSCEKKDDVSATTQNMETEENNSKQEPPPAPKKRTEVRKRTLRKPLQLIAETSAMPPQVVQNYIEAEAKMAAADKLAIETADSKNSLESYIYDMQSKLSSSLNQYTETSVANKFREDLESATDWLYSQDDSTTKSIYVDKLNSLKTIGDPIESRKRENEQRGPAISALQNSLNDYYNFSISKDDKYSHIDQADKDKVQKKCQEVSSWLSSEVDKQKKQPLFKDPTLTVSQLNNKRSELQTLCNPIVSKPKPAPPKTEEKKPEEKEQEKSKSSDSSKQEPPPIPDETGQKQQQPPKEPSQMELD